jgi:4-amino-4-deoxy-L-arabinose transferase-like glycosyltransferase
VAYVALAAASLTRTSATWDEPQHLAAGYTALAARDYRVDPEHPPLVRLLAAVPRVVAGDRAPLTALIDRTSPTQWVSRELFGYSHDVLYADRQADRRLYSARFAIVALGVLLGALIFFWAREWLGYWPAVAALAMYAVEPNLLAHASLVTTDFGVTCFIFAAVYALWRYQRKPSRANAAWFVAAFVCAQLTKFSALALVPIVLVLLVGCAAAGRLRWTEVAGLVVALVLATFAGIWVVYGLRYAPSESHGWLFAVHDDPVARQRLPALAALIRWIDAHALLPNAYAEGLLLSQAKAQVREAFLAGRTSDSGWWYYFPVAFLLKTPIALLVALVLGSVVAVARRGALGVVEITFVFVPAAVFLALAIATPLNIGLRHLLPMYPFVILLAAAASYELLTRSEGRTVLAVLAVLWLLEFARAYPHNLAFFNAFAGGPSNGHAFLVDSNVDWGQDLKPLKGWMDRNAVDQIGLAYFGTADADYYGLRYTPLPGSGFFADGAPVPPRLPGYVAVSVTLLHGVYLDERLREFYAPLRALTPVASIGYSINVYRVEGPWWLGGNRQ